MFADHMIYHYTSIETLALILDSRKIRFSRLDSVDDPEEYQYTIDEKNIAENTFVSCWTRCKIDTIPQWLMYGCNHHGVRIGMPEEMFLKHDKAKTGAYCIGNPDVLWKNNLFLAPILNGKDPLYDIEYLDDLSGVRNKIIKDFVPNSVDTKEIGRYKSRDWAFQKECRFSINIFSKNQIVGTRPISINPDVPFNLEYYDIELRTEAYESMEIMLGAKVSYAERILVESLMKCYLNRSDYKESRFKEKFSK